MNNATTLIHFKTRIETDSVWAYMSVTQHADTFSCGIFFKSSWLNYVIKSSRCLLQPSLTQKKYGNIKTGI